MRSVKVYAVFKMLDQASQNLSIDTYPRLFLRWHNDCGFITCLAPNIFLDSAGNRIPNPQPDLAGLWVARRGDGMPVKIDIPRDCMAIQIGECAQIVTGGALVSEP